MVDPTPEKKPDKSGGGESSPYHEYPWYAPRFWHGMRMGDWFSLLWRNGCAVQWHMWPASLSITLFSVGNSLFGGLQDLIHGRAIAQTQLIDPTVFIVGHWRSGTTYLHELMDLDKRYHSPSTFECFSPAHFLLTEWWVTNFLWFMLPGKRPMDNVASGWDRPQEDEFALTALGLPSPMCNIAFPNHPPQYLEYLDMQGLPPAALEHWKTTFLHYLQALTYHRSRPLILKSPPHTGRVGLLHEMFPQARFVHIVRDPYAIVPSTVRLWKSLSETQGLHWPNHEGMEEYVFQCYERMYGGFERARPNIADHCIVDVRYEDLVRDPEGEMRRIYAHLQLEDFDALAPRLREFAGQQKDYKTNVHKLDAQLKAQIDARWQGYIEKYGYGNPS